MKKLPGILAGMLILLLIVSLTGCTEIPDSLQMDVSRGSKPEQKLLHVNASDETKRNQINGIKQALTDAKATDKPIDYLGYYPDYIIEIHTQTTGETIKAVVDINREKVEFYYPGPSPAENDTVYLSDMSSEEFLQYIHTP